jgi:hypothetical protein
MKKEGERKEDGWESSRPVVQSHHNHHPRRNRQNANGAQNEMRDETRFKLKIWATLLIPSLLTSPEIRRSYGTATHLRPGLPPPINRGGQSRMLLNLTENRRRERAEERLSAHPRVRHERDDGNNEPRKKCSTEGKTR